MASRRSVEETYWRYTERRGPSECWPWKGNRNRAGYGRIFRRDQGFSIYAHRAAWVIAQGQDFPEGLIACHHCDNPSCVNPAHIYPGTYLQNAADAHARGRQPNKKLVAGGTCRKGHLLTDDLIAHRPDGFRECIACRRERDRKARRWVKRTRPTARGLLAALLDALGDRASLPENAALVASAQKFLGRSA